MSPAERSDLRLFAAPVSVLGALLAVYGGRCGSPLALLADGAAIGAGLKPAA